MKFNAGPIQQSPMRIKSNPHKKVVLINQNAGYLMIDIANAFVSKYDDVVLISGFIKPMERSLNPSVKIQKIIKYNRKSNINRVFTWGLGSLQIFLLLFFKYRHYEVWFTTNPPMAYLSSFFLKNKYSIIIYDIYPESLRSRGIKDNALVYRWWARFNKIVFKGASRIVTLSNGMAMLLANYSDTDKIEIIPNWSGFESIHAFSKESGSRNGTRLKKRFVVLYAGNLGYTHSVETIIEVAKILHLGNDIVFKIIGEGEKKGKLIEMSKNFHLTNCTFMTWQPREDFMLQLGDADLAVITLSDEHAMLSVPSKTYNLIAAGKPLLCIAPSHSELARLVNTYRNGVCYSKDKVEEIAQYVSSLSKDLEIQALLSMHSFTAAKDFTFHNALKYL